MEKRKEKGLYIKCGKKEYQTREYKKLDPEQRNDKGKVTDMIRFDK